MIHIQLTEGQRRELDGMSRQAVGRIALRAQMVLLADRGYSVPHIAAIHTCGEDVVRTWLHRYEQHGVAGLDDHPRSGRPPKDRLAGPIVDAQASQSPPCSGHVQTCWSVGLLTAFLARRFRLLLSRARVRRWWPGMGWRWARPRLAPAGVPDPQAEGKRAALTTAQVRAVPGQSHLLSLDESEVHRLPLIRARGMKGRRVRITTPGTHRRRAFCGALDTVSGRWVCADHERKLAVHFVAFLQQVAATYPSGPLDLALDHAPTHTAKVAEPCLAPPPRVHLLCLPKSAAPS